jgi:hypothetical protein
MDLPALTYSCDLARLTNSSVQVVLPRALLAA